MDEADERPEGLTGLVHQRRYTLAAVLAIAAVLVSGYVFWGASLTHDESVYVDIAQHPFESSFYPGDTFLRHPPLGLALLSGWISLDLPLRAWPLVWTSASVGLLADGLRRLEASPAWLAVPVLSSPILVPLQSVTLYPPLFFFVAVAAWGRIRGRRDVELVGWNLAVFTHELALLALAIVLLRGAVHRLREGMLDPRSWAGYLGPYPAAWVWGAVMVWNLFAGTDARGGWVSQALTDPSPNLAAILGLQPLVTVVLAFTLGPLLVRPDRDSNRFSQALTVAALAAILVAPFHRYAVPLVPLLLLLRARDPPDWWSRGGSTVLVAACLVASALALGTTVTGVDTLNAGSLPGLVDHDEADRMIHPGEKVVVRSPPSFATTLRDEGWRIASTAQTGPAKVILQRGQDRITLHRAETLARVSQIAQPDALILPASWKNVPGDLPDGPWRQADAAGHAIRWEPAEPR